MFGWWDLEIISADTGTQFTCTEFKGGCQTHGVCLKLAAPEHQEMNIKVEITWRMLRTIAHSLMVHPQVLESNIHFALTYTADNNFPVIPIKDLINKDGETNIPFKLATGMKPSISHLCV